MSAKTRASLLTSHYLARKCHTRIFLSQLCFLEFFFLPFLLWVQVGLLYLFFFSLGEIQGQALTILIIIDFIIKSFTEYPYPDTKYICPGKGYNQSLRWTLVDFCILWTNTWSVKLDLPFQIIETISYDLVSRESYYIFWSMW